MDTNPLGVSRSLGKSTMNDDQPTTDPVTAPEAASCGAARSFAASAVRGLATGIRRYLDRVVDHPPLTRA
jgi:hypothetical protein